MKYSITILLIWLCQVARGQTLIKIEDVKEHVGDSVKLMAKIYGGKYLESSQGTPTFLNVGAKYPDNPLTLVIWSDVRKQFKGAPEDMYNQGYEEWITGRIELYRGKPEIVIHSPSQIYDVVAAPVERSK
jgi:hypothetical protein